MKHVIIVFGLFVSLMSLSCKPSSSAIDLAKPGVVEEISTASAGNGQSIEISFEKGPAHNYPLMAIWVEDLEGNYLQTLYVAKSIATGVFAYGSENEGKWAPGERRRPAALPYWAHKRGVKARDGLYVPDAATAIPDAYTGATPKSSFQLNTRLDEPADKAFRLLFEINQSWDWNEYWTNTKYPEDEHYKTSSQPAVVYAGVIDPSQSGVVVFLEPIGRSHHAGQDGQLYLDLHTLSTALKITGSIRAKIIAD